MVAQNYIPQKLNGFVELIAHQQSDQPCAWTFLPDGISCLMFRLRPEIKFQVVAAKNIDESNNPSDRFCFITGFSTGPVQIKYTAFDYIGAYLTPIALKAMFGIAAHDLKDFAIDGSLVFTDLALVEDKLHELPTFMQKAKWLEDWLYGKIRESARLHEAMAIHRLAQRIHLSHFGLRGKQLEDMMGYSRAHTHRLFNEWFGLSSQKYQKLMRFVRALEVLHSSKQSFTAVGLQQGYFDQAHFVRTFKEFTNMTPSVYVQNKTDLIGQLPTDETLVQSN